MGGQPPTRPCHYHTILEMPKDREAHCFIARAHRVIWGPNGAFSLV